MSIRVLQGDCRDVLPTLEAGSVQICVTSPPYYGLRDYGVAGQIGLEPTPDEYVSALVETFREVRRVLRDDGTLWLNLGDSYCSIGHKKSGSGYGTTGLAGGKAQEQHPLRRENNGSCWGARHKDLLMIPARVALALQADGWYLRSQIVWHKPNPMPESVRDRPTSAWESVFLLAKQPAYYYDAAAVSETATVPGGRRCGPKNDSSRNDSASTGTVRGDGITRNLRNVWTIAPKPYRGAHFATMPIDLAETCIRAGSRPGDTVLDPFSGAGTVAMQADRMGRNAIGIDLSADYHAISSNRLVDDAGLFAEVTTA